MLSIVLNLLFTFTVIRCQVDPTATRRVRPISTSFDEIRIDGPFDVNLNQIGDSGNSKVEVEAHVSIQPHIITEVIDNHTLSVHTQGTFHAFRNINVRIYFKAPLRRYAIYGTGNTNTQNNAITNYNDEKFTLANHGTANIAMYLNVSDFDANLSGTGNSRFWGQVRETANFDSKGVGDVNALNLIAKKVSVSSSGVSTVRVAATDDAEIKVTGVSTVYYRLPAGKQPLISSSTGLGQIIPIV